MKTVHEQKDLRRNGLSNHLMIIIRMQCLHRSTRQLSRRVLALSISYRRTSDIHHGVLPTLPMTLIDKPPSLTEAIRRTQRILHELHIHHLPLRHIHFAQTAKGESVSLPMAILGAVDEVAQNGDVLGLVRGIGGVGSAERGTDVELLDGPVPADVDESLVNCGWAGLVVGAALGLDLGYGVRDGCADKDGDSSMVGLTPLSSG